MARNSRFRSTSGPSSGRSGSGKKPFKKEGAPKKDSFRKDSKTGDRKPPYGKSKPFSKRPPHDDERQKGPPGKPGEFIRRGSKPFSKDDFKRRGEGDAGPKPVKRMDDELKGSGPSTDWEKQAYAKRPDSKQRRSSGPGKEGGYQKDRESSSKRKSFVDSRLDRQRKGTEVGKSAAPVPAADGLIRLNKFISNSGVCSRREADDLIAAGLVTVNGKSITEMGHKVKATDDVRYEGKRLKAEQPVYILLNKPKGFITTTDDPQERNTVMQLIHGACKERVYPVGRLDRNTSGLLLLTNDGDMTDKLTHPSYNVKKIYKAELDKALTKNDFQKIRDGVRLEEGKAIVDDLAIVSDDGKTVGIEIHIGWNRIIRRIFEALGYDVVKLDRSVYATLDKKDLSRGHWRFLRQDEIIRLKHFQ
ncbi:MAG: pseudouridine synthase [Cytophagales bacterium]|nr:pseudouridine synthase [Cytophagales bacterium]